ncbi:MAG TPA: inositol monophosphatase family protein [Actinomycetes bacterium]|nr:inositol monophosphatase family protein [Actinomycetes bacterium]
MTGRGDTQHVGELALAHDLADAADQVSLALYRDGELLVARKPDLTEVTQADRAVEDRLRELLAERRPGHGILGEERGASGDQRIRWVIDPIDATRNFIRGNDMWGTLLAFEAHGQVEVAMVSAPALGRRWWVVRGQGACTTGPLDPRPRPLAVSRVNELAGAQLAYGDLRHDRWFQAPAGRCWRTRGIGDFLMWCLLADGAVDVVVGQDTDQPWDLAAPILLVEEAGGRVTGPAGQPWTGGQPAIGSNCLLHPAVVDLIGAADTPRAATADRGG